MLFLINLKRFFTNTKNSLIFIILFGCGWLTILFLLFGFSRNVPNFNPIWWFYPSLSCPQTPDRRHTDRNFRKNRFFWLRGSQNVNIWWKFRKWFFLQKITFSYDENVKISPELPLKSNEDIDEAVQFSPVWFKKRRGTQSQNRRKLRLYKEGNHRATKAQKNMTRHQK